MTSIEDAWLLVKRDLYYMPDGAGYTGVRDRAGRYTEAEARAHAHDPGEGGNPVTMIRLRDAPEFSKACWDDVARSHLRGQRDALSAALDVAMVGGNHLANYLIGRLGGGFSDRLPPGTPHTEARAQIGNQDDYEVWCCWNAIMRARGIAP